MNWAQGQFISTTKIGFAISELTCSRSGPRSYLAAFFVFGSYRRLVEWRERERGADWLERERERSRLVGEREREETSSRFWRTLLRPDFVFRFMLYIPCNKLYLLGYGLSI